MNRYELYTFILFIFISTTSIFPWNLFINAHEYFRYKLRNVTSSGENDSLTYYQELYEGWVSVTSGLSCVLGSVLNFSLAKRLNNKVRIVFGHVVTILSLIPAVVFTFVDTDHVQGTFFWCTMLLSSMACLASVGFIGCGLLGLAAAFPPRNVQAFMMGQSFAGVLSSIFSIIFQTTASNEVVNGRLSFFIVLFWTFFSALFFFFIPNIESVSYPISVVSVNTFTTVDSDNLLSHEDTENIVCSDEEISLLDSFYTTLSSVKVELTSISLTAFITLAMFPSIASLVESNSNNSLWKSLYSSIACFLFFNVCDGIGRLCSYSFLLNETALLILSAMRIIFIPLLYFCNITHRYHSVTIFHSDAVFMCINMLSAFSNGFLFSIANIIATKKVSARERDMLGSVLGLIANIWAFFGSLAGFSIIYLI